MLGGFLARKGDGEPGVKTLWTGLQRVTDFAAGLRFMRLSGDTLGLCVVGCVKRPIFNSIRAILLRFAGGSGLAGGNLRAASSMRVRGHGFRLNISRFRANSRMRCRAATDASIRTTAWRRGGEATRRGDGLRAQWPNRAASQVANTLGVTPARLRACQLTRATRRAHGFRGNRAIRSALFNGIPHAETLPPGRKSAQFFNQARNDLSRNVAVVGCAEVVLHCDLRGHVAGLHQHPIALRPGVFCA